MNRKDAQGQCVMLRGQVCEGHSGTDCEICEILPEALIRRQKNRDQEASETLSESNLEGDKVLQVRKTQFEYIVIVGRRYKDEPERPDIFFADKVSRFEQSEFSCLAESISSLR